MVDLARDAFEWRAEIALVGPKARVLEGRLKIPISVHILGKSAIFTPLYLRNEKRCNAFLIKFGHGAPPRVQIR